MGLFEKTKEICKLYDIKPTRTKGQNFLINEDVYDNIVENANISEKDVVLEVGPGLGFLTAKLAKKAKQVIAVELDDKLAEFLVKGIESQKVDNIEVINENILDINIEELFKDFKFQISNFKVVANLPYNISSVFLRRFLAENKIKPTTMVLMLQKEVAERIVALPGDMSLLACSVQFYSEAEIAKQVPASDFWPAPEVDSAVIKIKLRKDSLDVDEKKFFQMLKFGFSAKRKMLRNNLSAGLRIKNKEAEDIIVRAGLEGSLRAEDLSLDDWYKLYLELDKD